jgi:hypothetical protein
MQISTLFVTVFAAVATAATINERDIPGIECSGLQAIGE